MHRSRFKTYIQNQNYLLPPSWDEKIDANHPVRIVNKIIDALSLEKLYRSYNRTGPSPYDPRMLLKAIVYGYLNNIFSSRRIEEAVKSNIYFIWLCGGNEPDHHTINRFRSGRLTPVLKEIFTAIVKMLAEEGLLSLKEVYIDGTKMEANAGRYTFVWGKSIKTNKKKMAEKLNELWQETQNIASAELQDKQPVKYDKINCEKVNETIKTIDEALQGKKITPELKKKLKYAKNNYPARMAKYEEQEAILNGRGSYSKTDHDATFMRTKDDHMGNGQLKASYNVQISTNNQYIVNYDLFQYPDDTRTLSGHLDSFSECHGFFPDAVIADSGYGSEENYACMEEKAIEAYVKYNHFHREEKGQRQKKYPFSAEYLHYNPERDYCVCPMGQHMELVRIEKEKTGNGFEKTIHHYRAQNCRGCPMRGVCYKGREETREIAVNHNLRRLKQKARENLTESRGKYHRSRRCCDVETPFGNIKQNKGFRRFMMRGIDKVGNEWGLLSIAHNLGKKIAHDKANRVLKVSKAA
jgi:transposase